MFEKEFRETSQNFNSMKNENNNCLNKLNELIQMLEKQKNI